ncbi:helix-turn-helix transcriptional regulator [Staphylococcus sp. 2S1]
MFSQNLKYLRNKHDMEQIDLANKLGKKSASSISEWEKGKYTPKLKTLSEIASIFKVSIDDLMDEDLSSQKEEKQQTNSFETIACSLRR